MVRTHILLIAATLLSWVWYVILVLSIFGLSAFHVAANHREYKLLFYGCVLVAGLCSMLSLCVWMIFTRAWFSDDLSYVPYLLIEVEEEQQQDQARSLQLVWGVIAYMCGMLWGAASYCVFYFVNQHGASSLEISDDDSTSSCQTTQSITERIPDDITIIFATTDE